MYLISGMKGTSASFPYSNTVCSQEHCKLTHLACAVTVMTSGYLTTCSQEEKSIVIHPGS